MNEDQNHLELLSIFHFVVAGIAALFGLLPIFHLVFGIGMITSSLRAPGGFNPEAIFGCFFVLIPVVIIACFWAYAICLVYAGRYLRQQTRYTFCLVMAAVSCTFFPFGTALGVFTILVLMRPSVQRLFGRDVAASPVPEAVSESRSTGV